MKRDIDLSRQLLLDIEARGSDCSVSVLRTTAEHDAEERARYHLRLLVDGGYLKEVDRTANGVPCLRLTDAGHELIELCRSEARWREAKWHCQQRTGGLSLVVVRGILLEWALGGRRRHRDRYRSVAVLPRERSFVPTADLEPCFEEYYDDPQEPVRYVRVRPKHRNGWPPRWDRYEGAGEEFGLDATLPEYLV